MKTTELAHIQWKQLVSPGDILIDATCGNGKDTLFLASLLKGKGQIFSYDIQKLALENTQKLLENSLTPEESKVVTLIHGSHEHLTTPGVKLIVYNLGYLPTGDKAITTKVETTLKSLECALPLLTPDGAISITCYPGHMEGQKEEMSLVAFLESLSSREWSVLYHKWINRKKAPSLILVRRQE